MKKFPLSSTRNEKKKKKREKGRKREKKKNRKKEKSFILTFLIRETLECSCKQNISYVYYIFNSYQPLFAFLDNGRCFMGNRVWKPDISWSVAKIFKLPPIMYSFDAVYIYRWIQCIDFRDVVHTKNTAQRRGWTMEEQLPWSSILKEKDYLVKLIWIRAF